MPGVKEASDSRGVDDEPIPLALDVLIRRLFGDVETVKFKLPGDLLLPLEYHQRNLEVKYQRQVTKTVTYEMGSSAMKKTYL